MKVKFRLSLTEDDIRFLLNSFSKESNRPLYGYLAKQVVSIDAGISTPAYVAKDKLTVEDKLGFAAEITASKDALDAIPMEELTTPQIKTLIRLYEKEVDQSDKYFELGELLTSRENNFIDSLPEEQRKDVRLKLAYGVEVDLNNL